MSVVPTFHPPLPVLDLLDGLCEHGPVVLSDDASPCTFDPLLRKATLRGNVDVVRHRSNAGIARGLNEGLAYALDQGASWLLTVDQDTRLAPDYIPRMLAWLSHIDSASTRIGVVGADHVLDGKARIRYPLLEIHGLATTPEVIQTGSLWNVAALQRIGGYDESFGIDAVDAAACVRLREAGYLVVVQPGLSLQHTIGNSRTIHAFGRDIMVTGHSPARRSTMVQNRLKLFPEEFQQSPRHALRSLRRVFVNQSLGLILEGGRKDKAWGTLHGFRTTQRDTLQP